MRREFILFIPSLWIDRLLVCAKKKQISGAIINVLHPVPNLFRSKKRVWIVEPVNSDELNEVLNQEDPQTAPLAASVNFSKGT